LVVREASQALTNGDTILGNGAAGVVVIDGSFLFAFATTVRSNGGAGMRIADHSTVRSQDSTMTGNGGSGMRLEGGAEVRFFVDTTGNVITGNGGNGVSINDLSVANFENFGNDISGNSSQPDVICNPQFSATRGALTNIGPGTTNCVEP
jgi:parallel beta helix pectate lyase-like protein